MVELKLADPEDLKLDNRNLKIGQPYWLKSSITGNFEGCYIINEETDPFEVLNWLKNEMIYIPIIKTTS
ncbi:hypothetical protein [Zhouia amylolytica]|uniref:hypothetical protein n=1 Tax=Zhouia amylolytica TaxID=376730 RepID=UPI0020CDED1E|nr:hypothetical protein [Zhouia amylolytica]MCQ0110305.1 hypothetical protein [Zhouia amylolytica]